MTRLLLALSSSIAACCLFGASQGFTPSKTTTPAFTKTTPRFVSAAPVEAPAATAAKTTTAAGSSPPEASKEQTGSIQERRNNKVLDEPALWEYNFGMQDPKLALPHNLQERKSDPEAFAITEEQIETLERDGVVLIPNVFDADWVEYLRDATAYQVEKPHFWAFAGTASKLYDYIQRNVWQTNRAFANFYYHSAVGDVLRQCGRTSEIRVSTDLLMVNPNKGFKWHQDNQNGPITPQEGLRFWITMDATPKDYGAPVYLKGSHRNTKVDPQAVFVDIHSPENGLEEYESDRLEFRTQPGDMLVWHPKTIHKIDGPADGIWTSFRRVLGGTVAKAGTVYHDKCGTGGVLSDLGRHGMVEGDDLKSSFFPVIYPRWDDKEAAARDAGRVGRSPADIVSKVGGMATAASGEKFRSFFQVLGSRDNEGHRK